MKTTISNQRMLIGAFSLVFVLALIALSVLMINNLRPTSALASPNQATDLPRTITVVGEGVVSIEPDVAQANIGVDIVADSVMTANEEANAVMEAIFVALQDRGVADQDVRTTGYNIWIERPYGPFDGPVAGQDARYHVNNIILVVIRDLDTVDDVLNDVIEAGANNIHGVSFNVDDTSDLLSEARALAVDNAEARAAELAELNQVTLGEVVSVSEVVGGSNFFPPPFVENMAMGGGGGPIAPGQLEMRLNLEITYTLE